MRKSPAQYNRTFVPLALLALGHAAPAPAEPFRISREDVIELRADAAWEDEAPDIIHFSGRFEMRVRDWLLVSDRATVRGPLEDPEIIELEGSPARLDLARGTDDRPQPVTAEALRIVYERDSRRVLLEGAAVVAQGESILRSNFIEYELDTDRLHASGITGVQIDLPGSETTGQDGQP